MDKELKELMYELGVDDPVEALKMESDALKSMGRVLSDKELMREASKWSRHYNFAREHKGKLGIGKVYKVLERYLEVKEREFGKKPSLDILQELNICFGYSTEEIEEFLERRRKI